MHSGAAYMHSLAPQKLEELDMRDCALSDSGVRELADGLPVLRLLNLEHCTKARCLPVPLRPRHTVVPQAVG